MCKGPETGKGAAPSGNQRKEGHSRTEAKGKRLTAEGPRKGQGMRDAVGWFSTTLEAITSLQTTSTDSPPTKTSTHSVYGLWELSFTNTHSTQQPE